ncbi:MAG: aminotransferase class V-fold PLP-dependent enzyme [Bacteroidales bacterium]
MRVPTVIPFEIARSADGIVVERFELERLIDEDTAVVVLSHVAFRSGFMYNMKEVTEFGPQQGSTAIWDLCHSAGATVIDLEESGADMAVGCTYKYLNGGPGSPSFIYVRKKSCRRKPGFSCMGLAGRKRPF